MIDLETGVAGFADSLCPGGLGILLSLVKPVTMAILKMMLMVQLPLFQLLREGFQIFFLMSWYLPTYLLKATRRRDVGWKIRLLLLLLLETVKVGPMQNCG